MKKNSHFESRVLSGQNRLSAKEKEAIFASVLREKEQREHRFLFRVARWVPAGVAACCVCAVGLFVLMQSQHGGDSGAGAEPAFAPRGAATERPIARVRCVNESGSPRCARGSKLLFEVHAPKKASYFAAFTTVEDSGVSIWYFPKERGEKSIPLKDIAEGGILSKGGVIGDHHAPGTHTLYGIFSAAPLSREEIKTLFKDGVPYSGDNIAVSKSVFEVTADR